MHPRQLHDLALQPQPLGRAVQRHQKRHDVGNVVLRQFSAQLIAGHLGGHALQAVQAAVVQIRFCHRHVVQTGHLHHVKVLRAVGAFGQAGVIGAGLAHGGEPGLEGAELLIRIAAQPDAVVAAGAADRLKALPASLFLLGECGGVALQEMLERRVCHGKAGALEVGDGVGQVVAAQAVGVKRVEFFHVGRVGPQGGEHLFQGVGHFVRRDDGHQRLVGQGDRSAIPELAEVEGGVEHTQRVHLALGQRHTARHGAPVGAAHGSGVADEAADTVVGRQRALVVKITAQQVFAGVHVGQVDGRKRPHKCVGQRVIRIGPNGRGGAQRVLEFAPRRVGGVLRQRGFGEDRQNQKGDGGAYVHDQPR